MCVCDVFCNAPCEINQFVAISKVLCYISAIRLMIMRETILNAYNWRDIDGLACHGCSRSYDIKCEKENGLFELAKSIDDSFAWAGQKQKDLLDMITAARRELETGTASASSQSQTSSGARPSRPLSDAEAERAFRVRASLG